MPLQFKASTPEGWGKLTQVGQKYPSLFSFARREGDVVTSLHPGVLCRDYLMDQLLWMKGATPFTTPVYGFIQIPGANSMYPEFYMEESVKFLEENLPGLNDLEKSLGIGLTKISLVGKGYYVEGDPWWYKTTLHLSWYTQALRQMGAVKINWADMAANADPVFCQMKSLLTRFPHILAETGYDILRSVKSSAVFAIHDGSGMLTLHNYANSFKLSYEEASKHYFWTKDLYMKVQNAGV